jgi:hypothetical protein
MQIDETVEAVAETPEVDEDSQLGDIYDKLNAEPLERERDETGRFVSKNQEEPAVEPEPETAEAEAQESDVEEVAEEEPEESAVENTEAPSYLPQEIKAKWKDIPAEAQSSISKLVQDQNVKNANLGRQVAAFQPIAESVTRAAQQFPDLNMTPQQLASEVVELAHTRANLQRDPLGTILMVAQQTGQLEALAAKLGGKQVSGYQGQPQQNIETIKTQQEIAQMRQQLQQANNPANVQEIVTQALADQALQNEVRSFGASREHWGSVEADIPVYIPAAQYNLGEGASNTDILDAAYNMAITAKGLKATTPNPTTQAAESSPKRTKAAIKAKSVNVSSRTGTPKPISEMDALGSAYDRLMSN